MKDVLLEIRNQKALNFKIMKIKLLMAAALAVVIGLTSCDGSDAKLAGELAGTWKGNATEMFKGKKEKPDKEGKHKDGDRAKDERGEGGDMTCAPTLMFARTDGTNGGTISISADYTVARGVESVVTATPVRATVNGTLKAEGTWTVKDGDEIVVNLDPSKTVVDVDTASLALSYAKLTDAPKDSLAIIKERVAANVADAVKPMLAGKVQKMRKFDDVKITGNTMTLEAGHNKMTFTKQ